MLVPLFPAASAALIGWSAGVEAPALHEYRLDVYGEEPLTVSAPCVQPLVAIAGKVADTGPELESVSGVDELEAPPASLLK